jgi:hypothetical protein
MRAVKALRAAGETVLDVKFEKDGGFRVVVASKPGEPEAKPSDQESNNEVEQWLEKQHAHKTAP